MKKFILFIALTICLNACGDETLRETFTPAAYKMNKTPNVVRSKKMISRLESNIVKYKKQAESGKDKSYMISKTYLTLGEKYIDIEDFSNAVKNLELSEEFGHKSAHLYYLLGAANANLGKEKESKDEDATIYYQNADLNYRKAVELKPTHYDSWYGLSILLFYATATDLSKSEAVIILRKLTQQNPRYYRGRLALAKFYYETQNNDAALAEYEKLLKDLSELRSNPLIAEYKEACRGNIALLLSEIAKSQRR